jgi:hypothetical protein
MIMGSLDVVTTTKLVGWVHSPLIKEALQVQATINNKVIGDSVADLFRLDLADAKIGTGHCGFEIVFQRPIDPLFLPFVETRVVGSTLALPRTGTGGFNEFFSAAYKRYPYVPRYTSILGGLWTDRSDATPVLKSRTDMGRITKGESGIISRFINEGLVEVDLGLGQDDMSAPTS